jgi:hypothetical protein
MPPVLSSCHTQHATLQLVCVSLLLYRRVTATVLLNCAVVSLHLSQVTSSLEWHEQGVRVSVDATMYAPGPSSTASLRITGVLPGDATCVCQVLVPAPC